MLEIIGHSLHQIETGVYQRFAASNASNLCFRGQTNIDWGLVPSMFREAIQLTKIDSYEYLLECERDCHREFFEHAIKSQDYKDTFEWLALEQHHGVPTRLLDWSTQLNVATFFAVEAQNNSDAVVFALNISEFPFQNDLGRQMPKGGFRLDQIRKYCDGFEPIFTQCVSEPIDPNTGEYLNAPKTPPRPCFVIWRADKNFDRLSDQAGLFSFNLTFGAYEFDLDHLQVIDKAEIRSGKELLLKVRIPAASKESIRKELYQKNVDEFTIYGGFDSLGKRVRREHINRMACLK